MARKKCKKKHCFFLSGWENVKTYIWESKINCLQNKLLFCNIKSDVGYFIVKIKCHCDFIIVVSANSYFMFHITQCLTFLFLLKIHEIAACQTVIFKNFDKPIKLTAYDSFTIISYLKFQLHSSTPIFSSNNFKIFIKYS